MSWLKSISSKLKKTSSKINLAFTGQKVDENTIQDLEDGLLMADVGVETTSNIMGKFSKLKFDKNTSVQEVKEHLAKEIANILLPYQKSLEHKSKPHIILVCGVNGNGKTTTIGKLASKDILDGKKVMLAACDTFRAAAVAQLEVWANRTGATFISSHENEKDPASVAYRAVQQTMEEGFDVLYIDTAGRLQNNSNLMAELSKIDRSVQKLVSKEHSTKLLILDSTTGQNAISQVENFGNIIAIDGLIITKLDGTAKAGVLVALASKFKIPINYIGLGEKIEDLHQFDANQFARGLVNLDD